MTWRSRIAGCCLSVASLSFILLCTASSAGTSRFPNAIADEGVDGSSSLALAPVDVRFAADGEETPDFQRHVSPLLGRLGCNGRACHGSFQGQGGFRLSLFGYDFVSDHAAICGAEAGRVDSANPIESLLLTKPTDAGFHGGGLRFEKDGWQYRLLERWIREGGKGIGEPARLDRLEVTPAELVFTAAGESVPLRVVARWADGSREDVTPLCRFQSNDPQVARIDAEGKVTSANQGDSHIVVFYDNAVQPVPVMRRWSELPPAAGPREIFRPLDQLVQDKLDKLGLDRSGLADDATFLRRVCLDLTGTLPTSADVHKFLADPSPDKRERKVDELLATPAYAAWWATFLCDMTGNNSEQLKIGVAAEAFPKLWYEWIRKRVADNAPYDEIVEGLVLATARDQGEGYAEYCEDLCAMVRTGDCGEYVGRPGMPLYWMRREVQTEDERANSFAHAFLGLQIECAQCHKHPFDEWTQADFQGFARMFSGVAVARANGLPKSDRADAEKILAELGAAPRDKDLNRKFREGLRDGKTVPMEQLIVTKPQMSREKRRELMEQTGERVREVSYREGVLPGGREVSFAGVNDIRRPLMEWLREPDNPYFSRALVNRVWARYFGVGIVSPTDDLNRANPPSNEPLLDLLARSFVEHEYDLKWLHREIVLSRTWQTDWQPNETNAQDRRNFSRALPRRLPAEAVVDAIEQASASTRENSEWFATTAGRAIELPGTAYGRPNPRNQSAGFALQIFGRSTRSTSCDCDRSEETSLIQTVYLQNDRDVHALLARRDGWLAEVADSTVASVPARPRAETEKRIRNLVRMQERFTREGHTEQAEKIAKRVDAMRQNLGDQSDQSDPPDRTDLSGPIPDDSRIRLLIEEAYLRTVCRPPTPAETDRCLEHLHEYPTLREGLAGVLWALINGSEFIVNH